MNKTYDIILDDNKIGVTELEKADAPMGVVFGKINFINITSGYDFLKTHCLTNEIKIVTDYPDDRFILTSDIPNLKVIDEAGTEINGNETNISGTDSDLFDITVSGISYPFYEEEFPHHAKAYKEMFIS